MEQPFEIKFDFALAHSDLTISLRATATLHHSHPYYVVDHFHIDGGILAKDDISVLPAQEIKQVIRGGTRVWVHKDSERESLLSLAIGKSIDHTLKEQENHS
ncbi:MAG: hypothetical protein ACHQFX_12070 [Chitinophagales bacterium]